MVVSGRWPGEEEEEEEEVEEEGGDRCFYVAHRQLPSLTGARTRRKTKKTNYFFPLSVRHAKASSRTTHIKSSNRVCACVFTCVLHILACYKCPEITQELTSGAARAASGRRAEIRGHGSFHALRRRDYERGPENIENFTSPLEHIGKS